MFDQRDLVRERLRPVIRTLQGLWFWRGAAVILLAAALIAWALVAPGDRTRAKAFRDEGLRAVVIVMGLALCFIVAGFIEGFVTPSSLPTSMRIAVGVAALAVFVVYVVLLGSRAERLGLTGLLGETERDPMDLARDAEGPTGAERRPVRVTGR